jgi:hypothetical protein
MAFLKTQGKHNLHAFQERLGIFEVHGGINYTATGNVFKTRICYSLRFILLVVLTFLYIFLLLCT